MELKIITPTKKQEYSISWLEVPSTKGSFVIEPGHAPVISQLSPGKELRFALKDTEKIERLIVSDGLLKAQTDMILIILTQ